MPQAGSPFLPFAVYTVSLSTILTYLAQHSHASVVIATLFHGSVNTLGLEAAGAGADMKGWSDAVSYGLAAFLIGGVAWSGHFRGLRRGTRKPAVAESPSSS
jgi:hypothetical protein